MIAERGQNECTKASDPISRRSEKGRRNVSKSHARLTVKIEEKGSSVSGERENQGKLRKNID